MILVVLPAIVVVLDQIAKALALRHLAPGEAIPVVDGIVALRLGFNTGLAFGLLAGLGEAWRWVVPVVSVGALIVLARIASRVLPTAGGAGRIGLGLTVGGALGNLVDRARHGAVIDFIDVYWRSAHWPAFNTADAAITLGVMLLATTLMKDRSEGNTPR